MIHEKGFEVDTGGLSEREIHGLMTRATEFYDLRLPVQRKVQVAHELLARWGKSLRKDRGIEALLERLSQDLESSRQTMVDLEVVAACTDCDQEEGKSCCAQGRGFEEKYDPYLPLMNLFLGVSLPDRPARPDGCYFLTRTGCCLKVSVTGQPQMIQMGIVTPQQAFPETNIYFGDMPLSDMVAVEVPTETGEEAKAKLEAEGNALGQKPLITVPQRSRLLLVKQGDLMFLTIQDFKLIAAILADPTKATPKRTHRWPSGKTLQGFMRNPRVTEGTEHMVYETAPYGRYGNPFSPPLIGVYVEAVLPSHPYEWTDDEMPYEGFNSVEASFFSSSKTHYLPIPMTQLLLRIYRLIISQSGL